MWPRKKGSGTRGGTGRAPGPVKDLRSSGTGHPVAKEPGTRPGQGLAGHPGWRPAAGGQGSGTRGRLAGHLGQAERGPRGGSGTRGHVPGHPEPAWVQPRQRPGTRDVQGVQTSPSLRVRAPGVLSSRHPACPGASLLHSSCSPLLSLAPWMLESPSSPSHDHLLGA